MPKKVELVGGFQTLSGATTDAEGEKGGQDCLCIQHRNDFSMCLLGRSQSAMNHGR